MATVICKRSIMFRDEAQTRQGLKAPRTHTIPASKDPQNIPDWVAEQPAFRHAVEHNEIMLLELLKPVAATVVEKTALPEKVTGDNDKEPESETVQLEKLNKPELIKYAQKLGIEVDDKLKKEDILAAIRQELAKT